MTFAIFLLIQKKLARRQLFRHVHKSVLIWMPTGLNGKWTDTVQLLGFLFREGIKKIK